MLYKHLVADIAAQTGLKPVVVKAVLSAAPDALMKLEEGEHVRTPLGSFRMTRRRPRTIKLPDGPVADIHEQQVVRLKPGVRVRRPAAVQPS
jgi:nucleoid DNA-binding protein